MLSHSVSHAGKSLEPPLSYPGATPDSERAKKPALPEPPYQPYADPPARVGDPPYEPYSKKPALPEPPYKPYDRKPTLPEPPYEPFKGM